MGVLATEILTKQPDESLFYKMDFTNLLETDEELSDPSVESVRTDGESSDLTINGVTLTDSNKKVKMKISGGTHGKKYRIEVTAGTSGSQIVQGDGILTVRDK